MSPADLDREARTAENAFRTARWIGGGLVILAVVLTLVLPQHAGQMARGLRTPMIAFELAETRAEIEALFGPAGSALRADLARHMDLGNRIDFAFMLVYGSFLSFVGLGVTRLAGRAYRVVTYLAPIAALCDVAENLQLLTVTQALDGDYDAALARLRIFTWLKWELLAVCVVWLTPWLLRGTRTERVVGALGVGVGALALGAFFDRAHFAEAFAMAMSVAFLGLWVVAWQRAGQTAATTDSW